MATQRAVLTVQADIAGKTLTGKMVRTAKFLFGAVATLAPGKAATLVAGSGNTGRSLTIPAGHGFTTGMWVDLFWAEGLRGGYQITVTSGSGGIDTIALGNEGLTGDNLPASQTPVVIDERELQDTLVTQSDPVALVATSDAVAAVTMATDNEGPLCVKIPPGELYSYLTGMSPKPRQWAILSDLYFSNGSAEQAAEIDIEVLYDA